MTDSLFPLVDSVAQDHPQRRFLDVKDVGALLKISWRTVLRLADCGAMPWGKKLNSLRRWDSREIEAWIADGCKPVRQPGKGG